MPRTIRILHFSPSTATARHDSHRAALGVVWFAQQALSEFQLEHRVELVWALPAISAKELVRDVLVSADILVIATPTYGQGSPWFVRKFFELTPGVALWGKPATAFATSGGHHTGGETAVGDCLRSLQGVGASTFSFAQKTLVFGTNQKFARDGEFDLIDGWFMRQFARTLVLQAVLRDHPDTGGYWAVRLGLRTDYYNDFPSQPNLGTLVGDCIQHLNAPLADGETGYPELSQRLGFQCQPLDASDLPFVGLLPAPPNELLTA